MKQVRQALQASMLFRLLAAMDGWFGRQWRESRMIAAIVRPDERSRQISQSSVFYKLWQLLHGGLAKLYELLRLEKLFSGSLFLRSFFWAALCIGLAPILPTMADLALAAVGYASVLLMFMRDKGRVLAFSPMNRYILLYGAVFAVASVFSVTPRESVKVGLLTVAFVLFALVLQNAVATRRQLEILLRVIVLAGTAVAFYGVCQYLFGWGYQSAAWVDNDMFSGITFRVSSTLQNPNMLGQYLILTLALGVALLLKAEGWGSRIFWLLCVGVMALCMILTFARGAWLGLLFGGALFLLILNPRLLFLFPVVLIGLYMVLPATVTVRFTSIGDLSDSSTSYRVHIWMGTLAMLKDYWLCGIGPGDGAFNLVYPVYSYNAIVAPHSHNLFLQLLCDGGVTLLASFVAVLLHFFRQMAAAIHEAGAWREKIYPAAILGAIAGFLLQAMTDYSFYNHRVMVMFWTFLAVGALVARRDELEGGE